MRVPLAQITKRAFMSIAAVGGDVPHLLGLVPYGGGDGRLEHRQFVQVVLLGDRLAVGEDFGTSGVMILGDVVQFVEQGQVS